MCHGPEYKRGAVDLRTYESIVKGGDSGAVLTAGNSATSLMVQRVVQKKCPPKPDIGEAGIEPMTPAELKVLRDWIVVWGGEFGRLPMAQGSLKTAGRDHGPYGFSTWMAGGGVKAGTVYGSTDDIGYASVENRVSIQDWHATILHLMGMHHEELVYIRNGLGERLTHQFETQVVHDVIA